MFCVCVFSRISNAFNHEFEFLNAKKTGMFRNKRVDIRHATWRTAQAVQVLCANFPKSLSWCFPSVLDPKKNHTILRAQVLTSVQYF